MGTAFELSLLVEQIAAGGIESRTITILTAVFTGMVMASQFVIGLEPFGASVYTGSLVSLGIVRELGPVLAFIIMSLPLATADGGGNARSDGLRQRQAPTAGQSDCGMVR